MTPRPDKWSYYVAIAKTVATRSTCSRRHYGAVIVNNDEIVATGYNGPARNTPHCDVCARGNARHNDGDYGTCPAVHAEMNAIISASRAEMIGGTLYLAGIDCDTGDDISDIEPCPVCMRLIMNAGIEQVCGPKGTIWEKGTE